MSHLTRDQLFTMPVQELGEIPSRYLLLLESAERAQFLRVLSVHGLFPILFGVGVIEMPPHLANLLRSLVEFASQTLGACSLGETFHSSGRAHVKPLGAEEGSESLRVSLKSSTSSLRIGYDGSPDFNVLVGGVECPQFRAFVRWMIWAREEDGHRHRLASDNMQILARGSDYHGLPHVVDGFHQTVNQPPKALDPRVMLEALETFMPNTRNA